MGLRDFLGLPPRKEGPSSAPDRSRLSSAPPAVPPEQRRPAGSPSKPGAEKYGPRTLRSIAEQCKLRGIPAGEFEAVLSFIAEKYGKDLQEMNASELKRVNSGLGVTLQAHLGGAKRRGEAPSDAW